MHICSVCFSCSKNSTNKKYHLSGLSLQANWSDMAGMLQTAALFLQSLFYILVLTRSPSTAEFSEGNANLSYLRSTFGHSYMCNTEQILAVTPAFSLNTFRLQIQPFGVTANEFAAGTEASFRHRFDEFDIKWAQSHTSLCSL